MDEARQYQDAGILGQLPRLKTYTHILLCFPLQKEDDRDHVLQNLIQGSSALTQAFPWLTYKVVHRGSNPGCSGYFTIEPCLKFAAPNSIVRVKDCSDECPSYEEIVAARGPVSMLRGEILGPVKAFPETYEESEMEPAPVFVMQANFVKGGILVDAAAQHNFIDGGGLLKILELLAKAMRGEPFTEYELEQGNRERGTVIPLLSLEEPMLDHSHLLRDTIAIEEAKAPHFPTTVPARTTPSWNFFRIPASKVAEIKARANNDVQRKAAESSSATFVSTNDALVAFVWRRVAAVRLLCGRKSSEFTKFSRAMDARRAVGVPREYMGQMGYNATCRLTFEALESMSLGTVALFMRKAVKSVNTEYSVRSWATFIAKEPDKSKIMFGGTFNPDTDLGLSSLIHASVHSVEFGMLGKPALIRRPLFAPLEGCVYFWSMTESGDVDVLLCLKPEVIEGLKDDDEEWKNHVEYIG